MGGEAIIRGGVDRIRWRARDSRGVIETGFSLGNISKYIDFEKNYWPGEDMAFVKERREEVVVSQDEWQEIGIWSTAKLGTKCFIPKLFFLPLGNYRFKFHSSTNYRLSVLHVQVQFKKIQVYNAGTMDKCIEWCHLASWHSRCQERARLARANSNGYNLLPEIFLFFGAHRGP